ncbi:MAG: GGDEF domain-containing protein [Wenzhouxiangella sp.]
MLDIFTMMVMGVLLCCLMALLLWVSARTFPPAERESLHIWILALVMQPIAWSLFLIRGSSTDVLLTFGANLFLLLSFAELTRALRRFINLPDLRIPLLTFAFGVAAALALAGHVTGNFSILVIINSVGIGLILSLMLLSALQGTRKHPSVPLNIVAFVAASGIVVVSLRAALHYQSPQFDGNFLAASLIDSIAVFYATLAPLVASIAFLLLYQERNNQRLEELASTDGLTGILNRHAMSRQAARHFHPSLSSGTASTLLIDLDHFKRVNDRYGHEAGDEVLIEVVRRIQSQLRPTDIFGRVGGEELAILLPQTNADEALAAADRIRKTIEAEAVAYEQAAIPMTASIGVACRHPADSEWADCLRRADKAMYQAKAAGRNCIVVDSDNAAGPGRPAWPAAGILA